MSNEAQGSAETAALVQRTAVAAALPEYEDLFRVIRAAGPSNSAKAGAVQRLLKLSFATILASKPMTREPEQ